jgi:hypothetical protein
MTQIHTDSHRGKTDQKDVARATLFLLFFFIYVHRCHLWIFLLSDSICVNRRNLRMPSLLASFQGRGSRSEEIYPRMTQIHTNERQRRKGPHPEKAPPICVHLCHLWLHFPRRARAPEVRRRSA